jgi:hypothetical protein
MRHSSRVSINQVPAGLSREQFLEYVKKGRAAEPQTGRFETLKNDEHLSDQRQEVCVEHRMTSKDYGVTRGGSFATIEYLGMNCIHPDDASIGVFVELSRKAPPSVTDPAFEAAGAGLLRSVEFKRFK